ncbi:MAG TPA: N-methyl-L-tryptophan oxidase [Chloroflexota bacterium]|nr:N-methyl-L-tryptophan oxidase [Chloroflexota bacterium]
MSAGQHSYDAIVIGVGGMGSATAYQLARRGKRVLGLERFDVPHAMGSSHGVTRIIRMAYYEHPSYVPLLRRAYALWRELERGVGEQLLHITGSIDAGPPDSQCFEGSRRSCELHDLPHEVLDGVALRRRFPGYQLPAGHLAVLQPEGGFLLSERCIVAHVVAAQAHGARIQAREQVLEWEPRGEGVLVRTDRGSYTAARLVIAAGAWAGELAPGLQGLVRAERQVLAWLQPTAPALFAPERFPVFNLQVEEGRYYGLPVYSVPGFKLGRYHHLEEVGSADALDRDSHHRDEDLLRRFAERYFPAGAGPTMALRACLFENSPDEHFIMDVLPDYPQVAIAAGFSGHGYKFCSVVGEIMADLVERGQTSHDIGLFRLARFAERSAPA